MRYTTCSCPRPEGPHDDPQSAERTHASEEFAQIIARHTGRHVVAVESAEVEA